MKFGFDITVADVKAEAERRIIARYPIHKQLNLPRNDPDAAAAMWAFIDAIRAASNRLEVLPRIPADYRDDRHWQ